MTRKNPTIIPPKAGWKPQTYYLVEVCCNPNNPCFAGVFYTGFLNGRDNGPGGYNQIVSCEGDVSISNIVFLKAIKELVTISSVTGHPECTNRSKCPYDEKAIFDLTPV